MTVDTKRIDRHFAEHIALVEKSAAELAQPIADLAGVTLRTVEDGGTLFFCGNGGSAADAQHLAAEYVVRFERTRRAIAAVALTTDTSVLTAAGNDLGFDVVFARQIEALGRPGDLLLLLSTSGESENVVLAARAAKAAGVVTAALLANGGGRLADEVDFSVVVPTESTARAQEVHITIGHIVCDIVDASLTNVGE